MVEQFDLQWDQQQSYANIPKDSYCGRCGTKLDVNAGGLYCRHCHLAYQYVEGKVVIVADPVPKFIFGDANNRRDQEFVNMNKITGAVSLTAEERKKIDKAKYTEFSDSLGL